MRCATSLTLEKMKKKVRDSILQFQIDDPEAGLNFSRRLSLENNWSEGYTKRVVEEYLRFLVLCAEAGHKVTPSDAVDQVWHLHMCYTESYWNDLCKDIIGFPLHHGPTKGGSVERSKFFDWYSETLNSYQAIFKEEAPLDIWPSAEKRFARQDFRRVDCGANFVISKKLVGTSLAGLVGVSCLAGCSSHFLMSSSAGSGLFWLFMLVVLVVFVIKGIKSGGGKGGGGGGWSGCNSGCSSSGCSSSGCGGGGGCGGGCGS